LISITVAVRIPLCVEPPSLIEAIEFTFLWDIGFGMALTHYDAEMVVLP